MNKVSWGGLAVAVVVCVLMGCSDSSSDKGSNAAGGNASVQELVSEDSHSENPNIVPNRGMAPALQRFTDHFDTHFDELQLAELNVDLSGLWLMISEGEVVKNFRPGDGNGVGEGVGSVTRTFTSYKLFSLDMVHPDAVLFTEEALAALPPTAYVNLCTQSQARYIYDEVVPRDDLGICAAIGLPVEAVPEEAVVEEAVEINLPAVDSDFLPVFPFALNQAGTGFTIPADHLIYRSRNTAPVQVAIESNSRLNFGEVVSEWDKVSRNGVCETNRVTMNTVAVKFRAEMRRPVGTLSVDNVVSLINCLDYNDGTLAAEYTQGGVLETLEGSYFDIGMLNITNSYRGFGLEAIYIEDELYFDVAISNNGFLHFDDGDVSAQYFIEENGPINFEGELQTVNPKTDTRLIINYVLNLLPL
ncbi:MAG: hypothetical protein COB04_15010 [Gammaproteobacteria bacterium]|nr:MAG: hypothetical protein COB04_15010 [Gammaproteobacteria bacterium]